MAVRQVGPFRVLASDDGSGFLRCADRDFRMIQLEHDVENPAKDLRVRNDWRMRQKLPKGMRLLLVDHDSEQMRLLSVRGEWSHHYIVEHDEAFDLIRQKSTPVPPQHWTVADLLGIARHIYGYGTRTSLEVVLKRNGAVASGFLDTLEQEYREDQAEYEREQELRKQAEADVESGVLLPESELWELAWKRAEQEGMLKVFDLRQANDSELPHGAYAADYREPNYAYETLEWLLAGASDRPNPRDADDFTDVNGTHWNAEKTAEYRRRCRVIAKRWLGALSLPQAASVPSS